MTVLLTKLWLFCFQIDYLQQKNQELVQQLDQATNKVARAAADSQDLDIRNQELEKSLQDIDFFAKKMQMEKDTVINVADKEMEDAKVNCILHTCTPMPSFIEWAHKTIAKNDQN